MAGQRTLFWGALAGSVFLHAVCASVLVLTLTAVPERPQPYFYFLGAILDRHDMAVPARPGRGVGLPGQSFLGSASVLAPSAGPGMKPAVSGAPAEVKTYLKATFLRESSSADSAAPEAPALQAAPYVPLRMR